MRRVDYHQFRPALSCSKSQDANFKKSRISFPLLEFHPNEMISAVKNRKFFPLRVSRFVSVGSDRVGRNARDGGPMNEKSIDLFQLWPWLKYWDDNVDFYLAFVRFWMPEAPHQWYTNEPGGGWICKRWQERLYFMPGAEDTGEKLWTVLNGDPHFPK